VYVAVVRGALTLDLGVGRSVRTLGPLSWSIAAPRDLVFEVISALYLGRLRVTTAHSTPRSSRAEALFQSGTSW
jgi:hypothetical protein